MSGAYCFWQRTERLRQVATLQTLLQARAYPSSPQMTPRERARISISVQIFGWPLRVRLGIARAEQNESALPRAADMRADVMGGLRPANGRDQMREALSNKRARGQAARQDGLGDCERVVGLTSLRRHLPLRLGHPELTSRQRRRSPRQSCHPH